MKLGIWHHRRGGQWMVTEQILSQTGPCEVAVGYKWTAIENFDGEQIVSSPFQYGKIDRDGGTCRWAWLARRRAIAALKRIGGGK